MIVDSCMASSHAARYHSFIHFWHADSDASLLLHRMYEDRFGTEDDPVVVPSLEAERIIGVTDPDDENLVVWGILRDSDPPRQFIEGGEFYLLKKVPYVRKVGDVLDEVAAVTPAH